MNKFIEIFTKIISFLSRVHLGRVMKGQLTANYSVRGERHLKIYSKKETSDGKNQTRKESSHDSARR